MSAAFHILTYEKESQKHLLGASVFGQNEIYAKLKEFKTKLLQDKPDGQLYVYFFLASALTESNSAGMTDRNCIS